MTPLKDVVFGQFSLAIGALFYTFWWLSAFKPSGNTGWTSGLSGILFLFLALFGLGGVGLTIYGIHGLPLPSAWRLLKKYACQETKLYLRHKKRP